MSAGDFDYDRLGDGYATQRRTDPRIAALVHAALGPARTVLNVGAGAGSYEPTDRYVIAIEPSAGMRAQRPPHLAPAIIGVAGALPLDDDSVDAAMAMWSVHQWPDPAAGLAELRRVARGPVVVVSGDGPALLRFWLADYVPEMVAAEAGRYPDPATIGDRLGGTSTVRSVPIPLDCVDGFVEAFYGRPERLLDPDVRRAQSAWSFVDPATVDRGLDRLRRDLDSGAWDEKYGELRNRPTYDGAVRLVISQ